MWIPLLFGLVALGYGLACYRGWNRDRVLAGWPRPEASFGVLYFGISCTLAWPAVECALADGWAAALGATLLGGIGVAGILISLLSLVWLPDALLPRWYLDVRDAGRARLGG